MAGPKAFAGNDCEPEYWGRRSQDMIRQFGLALGEALSGLDAG